MLKRNNEPFFLRFLPRELIAWMAKLTATARRAAPPVRAIRRWLYFFSLFSSPETIFTVRMSEIGENPKSFSPLSPSLSLFLIKANGRENWRQNLRADYYREIAISDNNMPRQHLFSFFFFLFFCRVIY